MKKTMHRIFTTAFSLLFCIAVIFPATMQTAAADTFGVYEYSVNAGGTTVTITGYTGGSGGTLTIPDKFNNMDVTVIGANAFSFAPLSEIILPNNLKTIEDSAFETSFIHRITIPQGVTSIGVSAFENTHLSSVTLPESLMSIGACAFYQCPLTRITIPDSVTSIGGDAFKNCSELASVTLGSGLTELRGFSNCTKLTSIVIPDSVTSIGLYALSGCIGLAHVTIPEGVTDIGMAAFSGCSGLLSVTIPEGVKDIGYFAFSGCSALTGVVIPDGVTTIGVQAFENCTNLISVTIPNSVATIGSSAFQRCTKLTGITLPSGLTAIDIGVFSHSGLTSIDIPDSVTSIGNDAFSTCTNLTLVHIGKGVSSIDDNPFNNCTALQAITVDPENANCMSDNGVLYIDNDVLYAQLRVVCFPAGKTGSYEILNGVAMIGDRSFSNCSGLSAVTIPDSVNKIDYRAFYACSGLSEISIPNSVTWIDMGAFQYCTGLETVTIPGSSQVFDYAFAYCTRLKSAVLQNGIYTISAGIFAYCTSLESVDIPDSVGVIAGGAFFECLSLKSVTLPVNLSKIYAQAFEYCTSLKSVAIPEKVEEIQALAFSNCFGLQEFIVDPDNEKFSTLDGVMFDKDGSDLLYYPGGKSGVYNVPGGVTSVLRGSFSGCIGLTGINFPQSVAVMESMNDCTALKSAYFYGDAPDENNWVIFDNCASDCKVYYLEGKTGFYSYYSDYPEETFTPNGKIAEAKTILPPSFTAIKGRDTNLWDSLKDIYGISHTGTILTFASSHPHIAADGGITYPESNATGNVTAYINKPGGTEGSKTIAVTVSNYCVIQFDSQGGSAVADIHTDYNTKITAPTAPEKTNYTFGGWYKEAACTHSWDFDTDKVKDNITLFGKWTAETFTVTFDAKGGIVSPASKTVTYGRPYGTLPTPTRTGYDFGGWYTGTNGAGTPVTAATTVSLTTGQTLYAKWTIKSYTVKFDAQGGSVSPTSKKVTYTAAYGTLPTPARSGYSFGGWYTAKYGGGKGITATTVLSTAADHTLYAKWKSTITVKPKNSYGKVSGGGTYTIGTSATVKAIPGSGKRFVKWLEGGKTVSGAGAVYTFTMSKARTLYADFATISTPSLSSATAGTGSIKLTWKAVTGAKGYVIYRASAKTGTYSEIKRVSALSYTVTKLVKGKTWYYKIKAYCTAGTLNTFSSFSNIRYAKVK
jgi:uncharacterized repeat protein (TIGR02543 family)